MENALVFLLCLNSGTLRVKEFFVKLGFNFRIYHSASLLCLNIELAKA